jgi:8-oxo-dGTP diphosphatase
MQRNNPVRGFFLWPPPKKPQLVIPAFAGMTSFQKHSYVCKCEFKDMKRISVVAAVIRDQGKILIAQRAVDAHQGGLWEFPGGKCEAGETGAMALCRELEEELGIRAGTYRPLIKITHDYPDKSVCLDVWEVSAFSGQAYGREGQPVHWVAPSELSAYAFPAANHPIITAARLPSCYLITPDALTPAEYLQWLDARLARGAVLFLFRAPALAVDEYLQQAARMLQRCHRVGAQLLLHGDVDYLRELPADGIHLPAKKMLEFSQRPVSDQVWLAASVHNEVELSHAKAIGVDFATLSPIKLTLSHPATAVLGWSRFEQHAHTANFPVYALGGMTEQDMQQAWQAGGQGVAGIRGF